MQLYLDDSGRITFTDGDHINRNSLNRKVLTVSLETALATRESLWVQFADGEDYDNINVNVLEPIRLSKEGEKYKTFIPDIILETPTTWFFTFAVRQYTTDGVTFSEQLTSDKVSFSVNDSFPLKDDGYASNGTIENIWQSILDAPTTMQKVDAVLLKFGDDLNQCVGSLAGKIQFWYCNSNAISISLQNTPEENFNRTFYIQVLKTRQEGSGAMQILQTLHDAEGNIFNRTIERSGNTEVIGAWKNIRAASYNEFYEELTV